MARPFIIPAQDFLWELIDQGFTNELCDNQMIEAIVRSAAADEISVELECLALDSHFPRRLCRLATEKIRELSDASEKQKILLVIEGSAGYRKVRYLATQILQADLRNVETFD